MKNILREMDNLVYNLRIDFGDDINDILWDSLGSELKYKY